MIEKLKSNGRLELSVLLTAMTLFCFALSAFRFFLTDSKLFLFLNWNLFLAFIPWLTSSMVVLHPNLQNRKLILIGLLGVWILFFPNSPYILTDLFHLRLTTSAPIWYDLVLILSFAWTGLIYGFVSLLDVRALLIKQFGKNISGVITVFLLFAGGFGVYLGRFLRWNSWDILQEPAPLLHDIGSRVIHPMAYPKTWAVTILMGILLNIMFWSINMIRGAYQRA